MRRCRLAVCALLALAAAAFTVLPAAQAARAARAVPDINIVSVTIPADQPGVLTVVATSATPVTSLTVHLSQGATDVKDVSDFVVGADGQTYQVQTTLTSVGAGSLHPGVYDITVDATDSGDPLIGKAEGQLNFQIVPQVMLNPASIDFDHPTAVFTGQVTGLWPGTASTLPVPQETVTIGLTQGGPAQPYTGVTDANGDFTISAPGAKAGQTYRASVGGAADQASAATSGSVGVSQTADKVAVTARLAHPTIKYGQTDSMTGTVTYVPAGQTTSRPLAGTRVTVARTFPAGQPKITATTAANGTFTAKIPAQHTTGSWVASAGGTPLLLLGATAKPLTLNVQLPTAFRQVSVSLGAFHALTVKACLNVTSPGGSKISVTMPVTLQDATAAKGPWKDLDTITATRSGRRYCDTGTTSWQALIVAPAANAWYRLTFRGSSGLQAATSPAVHRWRYPTRVTNFAISPRRLAVNGIVTVSGRLWQETRGWHPDAHRKVGILFRFRGQWFIYQFEPVTNARGFFRGRFTVTVSAQWVAQYDGDATHFGATSTRISVTVNSSAITQRLPPGTGGPRRLH